MRAEPVQRRPLRSSGTGGGSHRCGPPTRATTHEPASATCSCSSWSMYARLVDRFVQRAYEGFNRGDAERALARFGDTAQLVFHGDSRLGVALNGKDDIREWLRGLMALGLKW